MRTSAHDPLVSIVTPCLNSGRFLEQAILSVIGQDYGRIEYLVMDGGSTDETLSILERWKGRVRYVSEPDGGQAEAVNRGFARTEGSIFAFLNADDVYLPGAITAAVRAFAEHPDAGAVYGEAWYLDRDGVQIARYPVESFDRTTLARRCFICQPAAFVRRDAFAAVGMMNSRLRFAHDYDLWIRLAQRYPLVKIDRIVAASRLHDDAKTVREAARAMQETIAMLHQHYGYVPYNWLYGYAHHRLTGQRVEIDKPRPALSSALYSLALGARYNWRQPLTFSRDVLRTGRQGAWG